MKQEKEEVGFFTTIETEIGNTFSARCIVRITKMGITQVIPLSLVEAWELYKQLGKRLEP